MHFEQLARYNKLFVGQPYCPVIGKVAPDFDLITLVKLYYNTSPRLSNRPLTITLFVEKRKGNIYVTYNNFLVPFTCLVWSGQLNHLTKKGFIINYMFKTYFNGPFNVQFTVAQNNYFQFRFSLKSNLLSIQWYLVQVKNMMIYVNNI